MPAKKSEDQANKTTPASPQAKTARTGSAYHHGDLRQSLIDEAVNYLREHSADSLSLRALARSVGVSQTAPYRHFPARSDLFVAIALQGFEDLISHLAAARDKGEDTESAFINTGLAYVQWSIDHPETYQLFFDWQLLDFSEDQQLMEAGSRTFGVLVDLLRRGQREGFFRADKPCEELAGLIWAGVHGLSSLAQKQRMQTAQSHPGQNVALALTALSEDKKEVMRMLMQSIRP